MIKLLTLSLLAIFLLSGPVYGAPFQDTNSLSSVYTPSGTTCALQEEQPATPQEEVQHAFSAWLAAISTGNSDAVLKLYKNDAVLLPTLSPKIYATPEARKVYFDKFTAHQDLRGVLNESYIHVYDNIAVNSGLYTFLYTENGKTVDVPARFTFVYEKTPDGWMIVDHHSSLVPSE